MNFEEAKEALRKGVQKIEFFGFKNLNKDQREEFYQLLRQNAESLLVY